MKRRNGGFYGDRTYPYLVGLPTIAYLSGPNYLVQVDDGDNLDKLDEVLMHRQPHLLRGSLPHARPPFGDTVILFRTMAICLASATLMALSEAPESNGSMPKHSHLGAVTSPGCRKSPPGLAATSAAHAITVDGVPHQYFLAAPGRDAKRPRPLVVEFHGFGSTASQFVELTRMPRTGPRKAFIIVIPRFRDRPALSGRVSDALVRRLAPGLAEDWLCVDSACLRMGFSQGAWGTTSMRVHTRGR